MENRLKCAVAGSTESGDCFVQIEPGENGLELKLQSKLLRQFGDSIRIAVVQTLEECGIAQAKVTVDDHGALDWILRARVRTAAERAKEGLL